MKNIENHSLIWCNPFLGRVYILNWGRYSSVWEPRGNILIILWFIIKRKMHYCGMDHIWHHSDGGQFSSLYVNGSLYPSQTTDGSGFAISKRSNPEYLPLKQNPYIIHEEQRSLEQEESPHGHKWCQPCLAPLVCVLGQAKSSLEPKFRWELT